MGEYAYVRVLETFRTSSGELSCSRAATKSLISLLSTFTFNLDQDQWDNNESKQQVCLYAKEEREEIIFLDLKFLFTVDGYTGELCSHFSMASWFAFPSGVESNLKLLLLILKG